MSLLRPCPQCQRHVREPACPFCGAAVLQSALIAPTATKLTRLALATGVIIASACSEQPQPSEVPAPAEAMAPETLPIGVSAEEIDPLTIAALDDPGGADTRIKRLRVRRIDHYSFMRHRLYQPYGAPPPASEIV